MINQLIEIIGKEAVLFESFLERLEQQQAMLVANDVDGLSEVTAAMHEKLTESRLLDRQREELVERIRVANAIEGDINVTRLLEIVDENQANQLLRLRGLIEGLNDRITRTRNQNAMLLNQSRRYIARMMEALSRFHSPDVTYSVPGGSPTNGAHVAVNRRA